MVIFWGRGFLRAFVHARTICLITREYYSACPQVVVHCDDGLSLKLGTIMRARSEPRLTWFQGFGRNLGWREPSLGFRFRV